MAILHFAAHFYILQHKNRIILNNSEFGNWTHCVLFDMWVLLQVFCFSSSKDKAWNKTEHPAGGSQTFPGIRSLHRSLWLPSLPICLNDRLCYPQFRKRLQRPQNHRGEVSYECICSNSEKTLLNLFKYCMLNIMKCCLII